MGFAGPLTVGHSLVDFAPTVRLVLLVLLIALLPLSWWWLRQRGADARARLAALTTLTLFLTFDLIVFGSFTRLTDSGLGCPDWPGCYGYASPIGAATDIGAAQSAMPSGPVTWHKAWIEMIHRYLAMTVGLLILVLAAASWASRRRLPWFTLAWVLLQGLFGMYTVTLKLYPAVVTLHLLGGLMLLALLAIQREALGPQGRMMSIGLRRATVIVLVLLVLQVALGGWVSSNYAVLACTGFPKCNDQWWPTMDFGQAFTVLRGLGENGQGGYLNLEALIAIQMAHRLGAVVVTGALLALAVKLVRSVGEAWPKFGWLIGLLLVAQLASGMSNVVLGWPLLAALGHSAGAAALVLVLVTLLARTAPHGVAAQVPQVRATAAAA